MKSLSQILDTARSIVSAAYTTTQTGTAVDLAGYHSNMFTFSPATLTDGVFTPKLQDSSDNVTFTDVVAADQVGALVVFASNVHQKVGYIGAQRYVRPVVTVTGGPATGCVFGAGAVLGDKRKQP